MLEAIESVEIAETVLEETWREELMTQLLELTPDAFERYVSASSSRVRFC